MRILLSRSSTNQVIGGAELSSRDITRSLLNAGHESLLVTNIKDARISNGLPPSAIKFAIWPRYAHTKIAKLLYPILYICMYIQYFFIVLKFKPDILNPQSREDQIALTSIGKLLGIPVVWRDPGDLVPQLTHQPKNIFQSFNRAFQLRALKRSSHIITLNEDELDVLLKLAPFLKNKTSVVQSNVSFDDYSLVAKPLPRHYKSSLVIGTILRLEQHKGVQYLIEAFEKLQSKTDMQLELWIIGDGQYRSSLESQAKNIENVYFFGKQSDISGYLNGFDIFVQPSEFEGWGRNVREAMYFSLPVIGSAVGGIKKQIDDKKNGLLFKKADSLDLLSKLEYLVNNPNIRKNLGTQAHSDVVKKGDWNTTVTTVIIPIFTSLVSKK